MYYKLGQTFIKNLGSFVLLQIRANVGATLLLQIGAKFITNWGRCYKLRQLLQIGT